MVSGIDPQLCTDGLWSPGSFCQTNKTSPRWARVELSTITNISTVVVYNRRDCCGERLRGWSVYVGNTANSSITSNHNCGNGGASSPRTADVITVVCGGVSAKYVWVYATTDDYLHLAEIEVYSYSTTVAPSTTGRTGVPTITCTPTQSPQIPTTTPTFSPNTVAPTAYHNLARWRPVVMSQTGSGMDACSDGIVSTGTCQTSNSRDKPRWLRVDLSASASVDIIVAYFRQYLRYWRIYVGDSAGSIESNDACGSSSNSYASSGSIRRIERGGGTLGKYVWIYSYESPGSQQRISIAEIEAYSFASTASPSSLSPLTESPTHTVSPTVDPTISPTSLSPTSAGPTTKMPTTCGPSTASPTTLGPTTQNPTSSSPTTASPSTRSPTTHSPTTKSPATSSPTMEGPTAVSAILSDSVSFFFELFYFVRSRASSFDTFPCSSR